ncbi:WhiB family transcriptional regulator [Streptomyces sp. NPDC001658]
MNQVKRLDPKTARQELTDHPYYRYRGCAPDVDDPRLAAGDNALLVDAWHAPDVDGGEEQEERNARVRAAKAVCGRCPVLAACAVFGASVTADGRLAERHSILGGLTAVERTKNLVQERQGEAVPVEPAPVEQLQTEQKLTVLRALAAYESPEEVAAAAGLDVRTANWQRARITTQLGLGKSASRVEVLEAAVARGLLRADEVREAGSAAGAGSGGAAAAPPEPAASGVVGGGCRVRGRRPVVLPGQLAFDFDDTPDRSTASVTRLYPSAVLEAAA